jgi:hypothetical protein
MTKENGVGEMEQEIIYFDSSNDYGDTLQTRRGLGRVEQVRIFVNTKKNLQCFFFLPKDVATIMRTLIDLSRCAAGHLSSGISIESR